MLQDGKLYKLKKDIDWLYEIKPFADAGVVFRARDVDTNDNICKLDAVDPGDDQAWVKVCREYFGRPMQKCGWTFHGRNLEEVEGDGT